MTDINETSIGSLHRRYQQAKARIEKLTAALREIALHPDPYLYNDEMAIIARKALEGKDE